MKVGRGARRARGGSVANRHAGSTAGIAALLLAVSLGWGAFPVRAAATFDRATPGGRSEAGLALVSALDAREESL
jgi:hypothetical protein